MTPQDACIELGRWLPHAQQLITQPDTDGSRTHTAPTSRPPWNPTAALCVLDIHAGVRALEATLRRAVTGRPGQPRGGSDGNTHAAITAISQLGYAIPPDLQRETTTNLTRWTTQIRQLPAIDEEERFTTLQAVCHYCGIGKLRWAQQSGRVTCLRYGACYDLDGQHPIGHVGVNLVTQQGSVYWQDGSVTP